MNINEIEKSIIDQLDFLTDSVWSIIYINNQLKALFNSGERRLYDLNKSAPNFFATVQNEFYVSLVVRVCRILDNDKVAKVDTATTKSLLKDTRAYNGQFKGSRDPDKNFSDITSLTFYADRDPILIKNSIKCMRANINRENIEILSKLEEEASKEHASIRQLRNDIIAHSNKSISINKTPALGSMNEINSSIDCISKFIFEYHRIIFNRHLDLSIDEGTWTIDQLFRSLK